MQQPPYPPPPYPPPYGQPPAYGQQPYPQQPYPPQQQQQWMPPVPSVDPIVVPLRLVMGGLGLSLLTSVIALVVNGRFYFGGLSRYGFPFLAFVATALLIAGAALLGSKKQAGHQLAIVAAGLYVASLLLSLFSPGPSFQGENALPYMPMAIRLLGFVGKLVTAAALSTLALSLLQLGRARGRRIDAVAIIVTGVAVLGVVVSMLFGFPFGGLVPRYAGSVSLYLLLPLLVTLLSLGARAALIFATQAVAEGPVAPGAVQGSFVLGFLAGFFGGCIGLGLVFAIAKGSQTKRGAGMGFSAQVIAGIILRGIR
jgi:hypothetical protein